MNYAPTDYLLIGAILGAIIASAFALVHVLTLRKQMSALRTELREVNTMRDFANREVQRLQTSQHRKVDRALWMLVQVRADRAITKAPQLIREPLTLQIALDPTLQDAIAHDIEALPSVVADNTGSVAGHPGTIAQSAIVQLLAGHLVRRVAKTATTT